MTLTISTNTTTTTTKVKFDYNGNKTSIVEAILFLAAFIYIDNYHFVCLNKFFKTNFQFLKLFFFVYFIYAGGFQRFVHQLSPESIDVFLGFVSGLSIWVKCFHNDGSCGMVGDWIIMMPRCPTIIIINNFSKLKKKLL